MDLSNVTTNKHGEPTVTITLTGYHEIYRFAHHMETGQVEFGLAGNKIIRRLRRRLTTDQWNEWMWTLHGDKGRRYHPASKPRPATGTRSGGTDS